MEQWFVQIPKVELHAHLSGSISWLTLSRLLETQKQNLESQIPIITEGEMRDISECFELFKILHKAVYSADILQQVTVDVVEEFASDGVIYLELRTTLRPLPSYREYLHAVVEGIQSAPSVLAERIVTRLLISIDRARGVSEGYQAVTLAIEAAHLWPQLVVGVDLSGNPEIGSLLDYVPVLNEARANGLKTTVHFAEVPGPSDEWLQFLRRHIPDRLGHVTCLPQSDTASHGVDAVEARKLVVAAEIPLEICLTSNVRTRTVHDYTSHHLRYWLQLGQPICLCTDDKGVFCSNLSNEFQLAMEYCGLTETDVFNVCENSITAAFCSDHVKSQLRQKLDSFRARIPHF